MKEAKLVLTALAAVMVFALLGTLIGLALFGVFVLLSVAMLIRT